MSEKELLTEAGQPVSAMERIATLEKRVAQLETALRAAFGNTWIEQQLKGGDEPTG